jgi:hypothetical protein|tara:strand:- start:504 stop:1133 length:630 start_codon:yes stop_codon:yes gene_type:complete
VKLNLNNIINTLKDVKGYLFPVKKLYSKFKKINTLEELKAFIQERSAHVTQTTLYGYIKTRIGSRYAMMFEDKVFSQSINIAKWNIYMSALSDCTLYTFSFLIAEKNLRENEAKKTYLSILNSERQNGLDNKLLEDSILNFNRRLENIDWYNYYKTKPFLESSLSLYKWSPIADELKQLDKEIVLNSIKLKWNIVENEFKELVKELKFN